MTMVRFRLTGQRDDADAVINALHGLDGVEHVEEVDDLVPAMRDDSSSSAPLDGPGDRVFRVEVQAPDDRHEDTVRDVAARVGAARGVGLEFVDVF